MKNKSNNAKIKIIGVGNSICVQLLLSDGESKTLTIDDDTAIHIANDICNLIMYKYEIDKES